jgi:hypothetical protein
MTPSPPNPPSPSEFLSAPSDPDSEWEDADPAVLAAMDGASYEDEDETTSFKWASPQDFYQLPPDPLVSIAESLRTIAGRVDEHAEEESQADRFEQEIADLEASYCLVNEQLEQIAAIIKPSQSKLAKQIREVLEPSTVPADTPAEEPDVEPIRYRPEDDEPVEVWRDFAQIMAGDAHDWSELNRSQIRTALGIAQPTQTDE